MAAKKATAKTATTPPADASTVQAQPAASTNAAPAPTPAAAPERHTPAKTARSHDSCASYVVGSVPIRHDGKAYGVGFEIELTDAQAQRLGGLVSRIRTTHKE